MNDSQRIKTAAELKQAHQQRNKKTYEALDLYSDGEYEQVKEWLRESDYSLAELLEIYIKRFNADAQDIIDFVKVLGN